MGYRTIVLEPDPRAPAAAVADRHLCAPYDDESALAVMADACDAVTVEFENPPPEALSWLGQHVTLRPSAEAVAIVRDRRAEKQFLLEAGIPIAPFAVLNDEPLDTDVGFPALLKTAELGYDGKGQLRVGSASELPNAWRALGGVSCVLERMLPLDYELSVVIARGIDGDVQPFAVTENRHESGILDLSVALVDGPLAEEAVRLARAIVERLNYVGVAGIEMFVVDGSLVVNEIAPRPHNSGHWTLDGANTSQFDQQVRALCGVPLVKPTMTAPAVAMVNLLGDRWEHGEPDWSAMTADSRARLHLYGKHEARPGRKMGHLTVVADTRDEAIGLACELRDRGTLDR
jgi:5-(carboxyamino)imidazole ribonucleotide synthase